MFRIKRLYLFMLQTFLPVFLMTFFICLFIVLMQFLWRYIDEMVGKGLEISVLGELFFYAAVTMVPMSLPLALLLASLMTFGNLGERLELLAIRAAGVSLIRIMRPLIVFIVLISIGAFFFQNNVLPHAQVKMWTLLYSMRQKSPELDIPEGVFYDQITGYNLYLKEKNKKNGMMYDMMIYDVSKGSEDAMVILADSGKLKFTEDKRFLFLTLYSGESFENLRNQPSMQNNVPYRRESFSRKEIMIPFDANFNRMDDGIMSGQYVGKNMSELRQSIDSMSLRVDSIGFQYGQTLKSSGYFSLYDSPAMASVPVRDTTASNIDTIYAGLSRSEYQSLLDRAITRAQSVKQDIEYKGYMMEDEKKIIRRHEIEMHKKFTLSFACLIFFFIGAPLGAIIRKGGLGMPVVISVFLFIFYYIIDNSGYKLARDGRWLVWEGMWLSSAILLPLGIFLTYKAVNDSEVFNKDIYSNFFRKLFGLHQVRNIEVKEVVIDDVDIQKVKEMAADVEACAKKYVQENKADKRQLLFRYFTTGYPTVSLAILRDKIEALVQYGSNIRSQLLIAKLMDYPILQIVYFYRPVQNKTLGLIFSFLLPISIPVYILGNWQQKKLRNDLKMTIKTSADLQELIDERFLNEKK